VRGPKPSPVRPATLVASVLLLLLCQGGRAADSIPQLRAHGRDLAARTHAAELELYALDSRLEAARARVVSLRGEETELAQERGVAARRLAAARETLAAAQAQLGAQLRTLYEQEQPSFVSVLLSARSLDAAVQSFDDLTRAAGSTGSVIDQARTAQREVERLARSLRTRAEQIARLEQTAAASTASLEQAQADRRTLIDRLRSEQALNDGQLAGVQARAAAAVARAQTATLEAAAAAGPVSFAARAPLLSDPQPAASRPAAPTPTASSPGTSQPTLSPPTASVPTAAGPGSAARTMVVSSTGYSLPGSTAIGLPVAHGIVAVDPTVIPLGTRLTIPGYGEGIAADTGSAVRGYDIDLWFPTFAQAAAWGRQTVTITLH
jgi:3D (Asp-Asp-Asp) domain-containing protein/peptidoglycan hydrolase CwlO-like protein